MPEKIAAGDPLMQQILDTMRRDYEARDSLSLVEEVEWLRFEAEALMGMCRGTSEPSVVMWRSVTEFFVLFNIQGYRPKVDCEGYLLLDLWDP